MAELVKVLCMDLEKGMHVASLDRPWLETSFVLQGFEIKTDEDIQSLRKSCNYVYIDCGLSRLDEAAIRRKVRDRRPRKSLQEIFPKKTLKPYQDSIAWDAEYPKAQAAVQGLSESIDHIFENASKGGPLEISRIKKAIDPMISSISRNPDACIWLARMKQEDQYTYQRFTFPGNWGLII
jgi:hypothetical protein